MNILARGRAVGNTPAQFQALIDSERTRYRKNISATE